MSQFGKDAPAVGFAIYVDELMSAISRNKIEIELDYSNILILYEREQQKNAIELASYYRAKNKKIELIRKSEKHNIEEYLDYAKKLRFSGVYVVKEDEKLDIYSLINDNVTETDIKTLKSF